MTSSAERHHCSLGVIRVNQTITSPKATGQGVLRVIIEEKGEKYQRASVRGPFLLEEKSIRVISWESKVNEAACGPFCRSVASQFHGWKCESCLLSV